jgi:hypothetical protein
MVSIACDSTSFVALFASKAHCFAHYLSAVSVSFFAGGNVKLKNNKVNTNNYNTKVKNHVVKASRISTNVSKSCHEPHFHMMDGIHSYECLSITLS